MLRFILFITAFIFPIQSWAACTGPAGVEAQILYNSDHKTVQYCDGTSWIALGKADLTTALASLTDTNVSPTDGQVLTWDNANSEWIASDTTSGWQVPDDASSCSGGGITGTIRYNSGKIQVCNNTDWVDVGGAESGGVWSLTGNDISNSNTGNVGIGEPSPTTKLHVAGTTTTDSLVLKRQIGLIAPTSTAGWNYSGGNMEFSGGNVGIGTSAPVDDLQISSDVAAIRLFDTDTSNVTRLRQDFNTTILTNSGAGDIRFENNGLEMMRINGDGNVGIGTTSPVAQLNLSAPNNIGGAGGTFTNAAIKLGTTNASMYLDANEIHSGETLNFFSNGTDNSFADYIRFSTGGSSGGERVRIDASGNVGIGTPNPQTILAISGNTTFGGKANVTTIFRASDATSIDANLAIGATNGNRPFIAALDGVTGAASLDFYTDNNLRMRIDAATGKVGIGTSIPDARLHIKGASTTEFHVEGGSSGWVNAAIVLRSTDATNFRGAGVFMHDLGGSNEWFIGRPYGGSDKIIFARKTGMALHDGGSTAQTVNALFTFSNTGVAAKPGGGSWAATSDARLKDIDGVYERGLDAIAGLKPVRYHYKKDNFRGEPSDREYVGLIAQQVQPHFPEAVSLRDDGYFDLDTTPINFALINAIKELKSANDDLRAEFEAYKAVHSQ